MTELAIEIPGFDGRYLIDRKGRIFTTVNSRHRPLERPIELTTRQARGHRTVQLRRQSRSGHYRVEMLVAMAFSGGQEIRHRPGAPAVDLDTHYTIDVNGCWIWNGGVDRYGYGQHSGSRKAHRIYYERAYGKIPNGLSVCHHCDNRPCVNPEHLFVGTTRDNSDDMMRKRRQARGERVGIAKLTYRDVVEILNCDEPCFIIAARYGVSDTTISFIKLGKTWRHVPRPSGYNYKPYRAPATHETWDELAHEEAA